MWRPTVYVTVTKLVQVIAIAQSDHDPVKVLSELWQVPAIGQEALTVWIPPGLDGRTGRFNCILDGISCHM